MKLAIAAQSKCISPPQISRGYLKNKEMRLTNSIQDLLVSTETDIGGLKFDKKINCLMFLDFYVPGPVFISHIGQTTLLIYYVADKFYLNLCNFSHETIL